MDERAKILRELMEEKNMKVSDIAKASGLPYSTVKAILERGMDKAGYVNVCAICESVGITPAILEEMVSGRNEQPHTIAAHFDGTEFSNDELEEIRQFAEFVKNRKK